MRFILSSTTWSSISKYSLYKSVTEALLLDDQSPVVQRTTRLTCEYNEKMTNPTENIKSYSLEGLSDLMLSLEQPKFRTQQLFHWLYGAGVSSYDEMLNLPASLRDYLKENHPLVVPHILDKQISTDGTRKYVFQYPDGACVETVAIPSYKKEKETPDRLTTCFSVQAGCSMACTFCATGKEGLTRDLFPGEIVDQIILAQHDMECRSNNLVAMGQGEPFLNYDNTIAALRIMNSPKGLAVGARHIAVSSCGLTKGIERFSREPEQFTLAISLHSAQQSVRNTLMPALRRDSLSVLKESLIDYVSKTNRRVTLEYCMILGINDTTEALEALIDYCDGILCHINLLPLNPVPESPFLASPKETLLSWVDSLERNHIRATIRNSRGTDIAGACGQLKNTL